MTTFEEKVNAYRENKRLMEELGAMNDAIRADIITMMQGAPEMVQGTAKAIYKDVQSVRLDSKLLKTRHPDVYAECSSCLLYTSNKSSRSLTSVWRIRLRG